MNKALINFFIFTLKPNKISMDRLKITGLIVALYPALFFSQNIKVSLEKFRYEFMPKEVLPAEYKSYKVDVYSNATDGVPLNSRHVYIAEEYIKGLKNVSVPYSKSGIMIGGFVIGKDKNTEKTDVLSDLQVSVVFNNIEMLDKKEFLNKTTNTQTNQVETYYTYKLFFKFSYYIKVRDIKTNKYILDTLIDTPKTTLFPNDYRYDAFGNKIAFPGCNNKPDLDLDYNKNANTLYLNSKDALVQTCMNETKSVLKSLYSYYWDNVMITTYRVKSKSPLFDVCDTVSEIISTICDSTSFNTKNERHLNWHTFFIKTKAKKLTAIWQTMLTDEKYTAEFKNQNDKTEFIDRMKRNLILGYLMSDEFDLALKYFQEIEPNMRVSEFDNMNDANIKRLISITYREKQLYVKHKEIFNFK